MVVGSVLAAPAGAGGASAGGSLLLTTSQTRNTDNASMRLSVSSCSVLVNDTSAPNPPRYPCSGGHPGEGLRAALRPVQGSASFMGPWRRAHGGQVPAESSGTWPGDNKLGECNRAEVGSHRALWKLLTTLQSAGRLPLRCSDDILH